MLSCLVTDITNALENGWEKESVQEIVVEDLTLAEDPQEAYQRFFRIGHVTEEKTGPRNGLVVTVLVVHRFYALPKELRAEFPHS